MRAMSSASAPSLANPALPAPLAARPLRHVARAALAASLLAGMAATVLAAVPSPTVQPGPSGRYYGLRSDQFGDSGFVEAEFWMSGKGRIFKGSGTLGSDGKWNATVVSSDTPYQTAMVIRRPADPAKFNGIVIVEWTNVSAGYIIDVDWAMSHELFLREGYAYVGLATQKVGIEGAKKVYPERYANSSIPTDDISYDVMSQAAKALRENPGLLLGGLQLKKIFASGHSQSAARLTTYANAIQPVDNVYDGILIHGRANAGTRLSSGDNMPSYAAIRADSKVPVFQINTEMEASLQSSTSKAVDSANVRYWEVAGAAHADEYLLENIYSVSGREIGFYPAKCLAPANAMPFYRAQNAAYHHLKNWAVDGTPPPVAPRIERDLFGFIKKDANGNAKGGLRLPEIDVPVAKYSYLNFTTGSLAFLDLFACVAGGSTERFSSSRLQKLYPTLDSYLTPYKAAAEAALAKGWTLPADHEKAIQKASTSPVPR